jgi:uncharacterized protein YegL
LSKLDFVLVLDGSGSMAREVREVEAFVRDITAAFVMADWATQFAVISFDRDARILTHLTSNRNEIDDAMSRYRATGATSISDGLEMAGRELSTSEWQHRHTGRCLGSYAAGIFARSNPPLVSGFASASDLECSRECGVTPGCILFTSRPCDTLHACAVRCDLHAAPPEEDLLQDCPSSCGASGCPEMRRVWEKLESRSCSNTCFFASDNDCDDGGAGSEFSFCDLGSDCLDCGVRMSATLFGQRRRPDATPLVFLLSDGSQTTDGGNSAAIRAAADLKSQGVTLFTWGFGSVLPSVLNSMATGPADLHAFYGNDFSTLRARVDRIIDDTCLLVTQATIEPGCQPGRLVRVYGSGFTRQSARSTTVRFTVSATNTTIDQSGLTFSNATLLSCALPSGSVPVFDPRLGSAAAVPLHSYGGRV